MIEVSTAATSVVPTSDKASGVRTSIPPRSGTRSRAIDTRDRRTQPRQGVGGDRFENLSAIDLQHQSTHALQRPPRPCVRRPAPSFPLTRISARGIASACFICSTALEFKTNRSSGTAGRSFTSVAITGSSVRSPSMKGAIRVASVQAQQVSRRARRRPHRTARGSKAARKEPADAHVTSDPQHSPARAIVPRSRDFAALVEGERDPRRGLRICPSRPRRAASASSATRTTNPARMDSLAAAPLRPRSSSSRRDSNFWRAQVGQADTYAWVLTQVTCPVPLHLVRAPGRRCLRRVLSQDFVAVGQSTNRRCRRTSLSGSSRASIAPITVHPYRRKSGSAFMAVMRNSTSTGGMTRLHIVCGLGPRDRESVVASTSSQ